MTFQLDRYDDKGRRTAEDSSSRKEEHQQECEGKKRIIKLKFIIQTYKKNIKTYIYINVYKSASQGSEGRLGSSKN